MQNIKKFDQYIAKTNRHPMNFEVVDAEGIYLSTEKGERFADLISGICVSSFGHGHPKINEAIRTQLDRYSFTMVYGEHVQDVQTRWAERFIERVPCFEQVYFLTTGTETIEAAMKLSKRATGRGEIIAMKEAYHGSTQGSLSLMWDSEFTGNYRPLLPNIKHIRFNNFEDLSQITDKTAAVVTELIQSAPGVRFGEPEYLKALRKRCSETGTVLVVDEIQTGLGRCGNFLMQESFEIEPDLLCLAKSMGGGLPVSALCGKKELLSQLAYDPIFGHISTFGGNPIGMAAANAVLDLLLDTDVIAESRKKSDLFGQLLSHNSIVELRRKGLYMALELEDEGLAQKAKEEMYNNGLLVGSFFFNEKAIRLCPPLTISEDEIIETCKKMNDALEKATS